MTPAGARKTGATIDELIAATGRQPHSMRGAISGLIQKKLGLAVIAEVIEGGAKFTEAARPQTEESCL